MQKNPNSFSFLVLAYNHEKFIIDHLESIKYQVQKHGTKIVVDLLISDDNSTDRTVEYIDTWIKSNYNLFNRIKKNFNDFNSGTCLCTSKLILDVETETFKLTAGDDIYSFENIFEASYFDNSIAFLGGFQLNIEDDILKKDFISKFLIISSQEVYSNKKINSRFINFSYNNAPNLFYNLHCIQDIRVIQYLNKFDVTEDWPIQIAISRFFSQKKYKYLNKVFVYYRRTSSSTYLVASSRFNKDRIKIFEDLIKNNSNYFSKLRLMNKVVCFKVKNKIISRLINIDLYLFFVNALLHFPTIIYKILFINLRKELHLKHYGLIVKNASSFKSEKLQR